MSKRKLSDLLKFKGMIFVYFKTPELCREFYRQAKEEGFDVGSEKLDEKDWTDLVILHSDKTLGYANFVPRMAFAMGSGITRQDFGPTIYRIDYAKFVSDDINYYYYKTITKH